MIKGGGAGRRYRPNVNAEIAITAMVINDRATLFLPSRRAQSSQKLRLCQTRQPFRFSCAPHSAQKLGWCIVGGTPVLKDAGIIFNCLSEEYHRIKRIRCSHCSFATWRSLLLSWHFKFRSIQMEKLEKCSGHYGSRF